FGKCDAKSTDLKGSASILHVPTGLFVSGAGGQRQLEGTAGGPYVGPDLTWWYVSGGISQNFFGVGKTVLFGEYMDSRGGLEQSQFLTGNSESDADGYDPNTVFSSSSTVNMWGVGITQHIDAAA